MNFYPYTTITSVYLVKLPHHFEDNGDLVVMEGLVNVPFVIARVFVVRAPEGSVRGQHAHKACAQFLTCPRGSVEVVCTDGANTAEFELNHPNIGLYIPSGIWAEQRYKTKDAALTVLCDRGYEPEDYIREYSEFLVYRQELVERSNFGKKGIL
jgi:UDP-2-acetamido-3-amino-2,3-dideoxy-glucuronate N-acetyltransferase